MTRPLISRAVAAVTVVAGTLVTLGSSAAATSPATTPPATSPATSPVTSPATSPVTPDETEPVTSAAFDCEVAAATTPTETAAATSAPSGAETVGASTVPATMSTAGSSEPSSLQIPLPNATTPPPSTASAAPTSAEPLEEVIVLGRDGLGPVAFCDDAEAVIATMTELAGPADDDTGWADPFAISACGGTVARRVTWGSLDLYFGDESRFGSGAPHFFGYSYGNIDGFDVTPAGLATPEGVGLGTPVAYLRATYPEVSVFPGEEGIQEPAFYVDENLAGLLTSDTDDGVITLLIGGEACGV